MKIMKIMMKMKIVKLMTMIKEEEMAMETKRAIIIIAIKNSKM